MAKGRGGGNMQLNLKINNLPRLRERRKQLRSNLTPAEAKLWTFLQSSKTGFKFRRQHSVGRYILDFYCPQKQFCIELDGAVHYTEKGAKYDKIRTEYLRTANIRVLRFENKIVFENTNGVLEEIKKWLARKENI